MNRLITVALQLLQLHRVQLLGNLPVLCQRMSRHIQPGDLLFHRQLLLRRKLLPVRQSKAVLGIGQLRGIEQVELSFQIVFIPVVNIADQSRIALQQLAAVMSKAVQRAAFD